MKSFHRLLANAVLILAGVTFASATLGQERPGTIFLNGKILTVDDTFSVVEALAVTGNRISAVGTGEEIEALAGIETRVIDLDGRTMIPGLIDNHNHLIFNAPTWPNGVRLGRVRTRAGALARIADKARELGPGDGAEHIVFAIGGWNPVQFTDDQREFTREELDAIAPDNPVYTQISWGSAVLNTRAMELGGITNDMPEPGAETGGRIWRDAAGNLTGKFTGSIFLKWQLRPLFPEVTGETAVAGLKAEIADYLKLGVTTSMTYNGPEFPEEGLDYIRKHLVDTGELLERQDAPPIRWYQDSGIPFGLGSDAQVVAHDSPFFTLYWVVSGKDTAGQPYFRHGTLTREEALIAHTRSNAYLMHKEDLLGTLEAGKLADLAVLDRDYMSIPADDIRDLNSVLTMVDGRIVYEAL